LVSNIGHFKEKPVQSSAFDTPLKSDLMHPRAAGRNDYSVQAMLLDGILDHSLTLAGARIGEVRGISHL